MKITVITLFPDMITSFFNESIIKRAQDKGLVELEIVNLRDFAKDNYKTVDDRPYGGGAGMVLKVDCIKAAIDKFKIQNSKFKIKEKVILTSPRGQVYTQKKAQEYGKLDNLIIVAGHYEGVDERITDYINEEISLGDFVMTGGEIAAAAVVDSIIRLLPGVLKKEEATIQESFFTVAVEDLLGIIGEDERLVALQKKGVKNVRLLEYPHYTRPETFESKQVPEVLLSGDHAAIEKWRLTKAYELTLRLRPDLLG